MFQIDGNVLLDVVAFSNLHNLVNKSVNEYVTKPVLATDYLIFKYFFLLFNHYSKRFNFLRHT